MALGTTINTSLVSQEIALSSNDVGELAQGIKSGSGLASKINKWSKYKPVRYNTLSPLTDAERKLANYGFDIANMVKTDAVSAASINWNY